MLSKAQIILGHLQQKALLATSQHPWNLMMKFSLPLVYLDCPLKLQISSTIRWRGTCVFCTIVRMQARKDIKTLRWQLFLQKSQRRSAASSYHQNIDSPHIKSLLQGINMDIVYKTISETTTAN